MTKEELRIVYMGTPDFAVESLRALVEGGYNVVAVITMPDKPAGRGHKVQPSPVKVYAESAGIPVLQPERLKDESFVEELRNYHADLQIVVAFRMLPEVVWSMPALGTFNLHASLLPQYRGAAPINWAVINGEKETGATTFLLKHEIDTGDILMQRKIEIGDDEDAGSVHDRLMEMGAKMVCETVDLILAGNAKPMPQAQTAETELHPAPKIFRETCEIDCGKTAQEVHNFVRGLSPYPAAWCTLQLNGEEQVVKIYKTALAETKQKNHLYIDCADGPLELLEIQLPNRRRMTVKDYLNGLH